MSGICRIFTLVLGLVMPLGVLAALTPAGTIIGNTATLNYELEGGIPGSVSSNTATLTVQELINVVLQWQDGSPVPVNSPDVADALTFRLSNTGNGSETFSLSRNNSPVVADAYDPLSNAAPLYVETNGISGLQVGVGGDQLVAGNITLAAEQSAVLYVMSDTPASLMLGNTGQVALTALSTTLGAAGASPGTVLAGLGDGGVAAVVGQTQAQATANGAYIVGGLSLAVVKEAAVAEGGNPASGKTLHYTITVNLTGTGTAAKLVINDPLPVELTFVAGSIKVNNVTRTDASDGDNASFIGNILTVNFGDTLAPSTQVITFSATVN